MVTLRRRAQGTPNDCDVEGARREMVTLKRHFGRWSTSCVMNGKWIEVSSEVCTIHGVQTLKKIPEVGLYLELLGHLKLLSDT